MHSPSRKRSHLYDASIAPSNSAICLSVPRIANSSSRFPLPPHVRQFRDGSFRLTVWLKQVLRGLASTTIVARALLTRDVPLRSQNDSLSASPLMLMNKQTFPFYIARNSLTIFSNAPRRYSSTPLTAQKSRDYFHHSVPHSHSQQANPTRNCLTIQLQLRTKLHALLGLPGKTYPSRARTDERSTGDAKQRRSDLPLCDCKPVEAAVQVVQGRR